MAYYGKTAKQCFDRTDDTTEKKIKADKNL